MVPGLTREEEKRRPPEVLFLRRRVEVDFLLLKRYLRCLPKSPSCRQAASDGERERRWPPRRSKRPLATL